ncbi:MAG: hypothetical protein LJE97_20235 [Betaproteobacteria bacterium]|nr:hypothetical protein [Betaproteobacteria bacterium]
MRAAGVLGAVALLGAVCVAPATARAEIFTIETPVSVKGLPPEVIDGAVTCAVFTEPDGNSSNLGYGGFGSVQFTVKGGAFLGRLRVPVQLDVASASLLRSYRCTLYFIRNVGGERKSATAARLSDPRSPDYREEFRRARGSRFAGEVGGSL